MNIFHQTESKNAIIAGLLWYFFDAVLWKMGTLEKSSYAAYKNFSSRWTCYLFDCALTSMSIPRYLILIFK
jgi:hypothetical protein